MPLWSVIALFLVGYLVLWLVALGAYTTGHAVPIWLIRSAGLPSIFVSDAAIHSCLLFNHKTRSLAELSKIEYAYDAVVGFVAVWIFTFHDGEEIVISPYRIGMRRFLRDLEQALPEFSIARWREEFAGGDVVDSLLLWEAKPSTKT